MPKKETSQYGVYEGWWDSVHIIAMRDRGKHCLDDFCWCEPVKDDAGVYVHNDLH